MHIQDKYYSMIAEGVEKFPKPNLQVLDVPDSFKIISQCTLCPLSQSRKKVVVSTQFSQKKFFILSEFPQQEDELSQSDLLYSEKSSSGLIVKLLEKLGLLHNSHFSFALKCIPEKGIPKNSLTLCAQNNLKMEITAVHPEVILCFGQRALKALSILDSKLNLLDYSENNSVFKFNYENSEKTVYFLSSSSDLQAFPHWRAQVWQMLSHFNQSST